MLKELILIPLLGASSLTVPLDINLDPEVIRQAQEHGAEQVRDAIVHCREGEFNTAIPILVRYVEVGDIGATYILANLYEKGLGLERDLKKASELFQNNVNSDHAPSMLALGKISELETPARALQLYRLAAQKKAPRAYLKLGEIYERGILGVKANEDLALSNYKKLAELGSADGQYHLARCYAQAIGVEEDKAKATILFRKAGLAGNAPAQMVMAGRYFAGEGCVVDPIAAVGWLTRASQGGSMQAALLLAQRYENGDAVLQDLAQAGRLYAAVAKRGNSAGLYHLGRLYANGIGAKQDLVRAHVLFSQVKELPEATQALLTIEKEMTPEQLKLAAEKLKQAK